MELWFTEEHTKNVRFSIRVERQLVSVKSRYQEIAVFDTKEFGKVLTLDGYIMLTQKDEFIYHEMITHIPMAVNPQIKNVLIIGAGDGGTVRELTRYKTINHIDMVEIDEEVVKVSKEYLPQTSLALDDSRLNICYEDGLKYVRGRKKEYDLIIVDSTDPFGPGEGLFTKEFYGNCYQALNENGILINQHESPYYSDDAESMVRAHKNISRVFDLSFLYQFHMPTYPSGHWMFGFASKGYDPVKDLKADEWDKLGIATRYYNTMLHKGAFALPNYVKELLNNE